MPKIAVIGSAQVNLSANGETVGRMAIIMALFLGQLLCRIRLGTCWLGGWLPLLRRGNSGESTGVAPALPF